MIAITFDIAMFLSRVKTGSSARPPPPLAGLGALGLLRLIGPVLPGLAVQERQHGLGQAGRGEHVVVGEIGDDGQAVAGHVLPVPAGVFQAAPQQLVELDHVFGTDHVAVAEHQHDGHLQLLDLGRPVIRPAHEVAHGVEQAGKSCTFGATAAYDV